MKSPIGLTTIILLVAVSNLPATTRYVWQDSPSPGPPYTTWATGAHVVAGGAMLQRLCLYLSGSLELPLHLWRASQ